MSDLSNFAENLVMEFLAGEAPSAPSGWYLSLHTGSPGEANDGANELTGNGYSRVTLSLAAVSGSSVSTDADAVFTASGGDWSAASHWGVYDASTNGNLILHGALSSGVTVTDGNTYTVSSGDLTVTAA